MYRFEKVVFLDPFQEIVVFAMVFDFCGCGVGMYSDGLVHELARSSFARHGHDDILGGHEREFVIQPPGDDLGVDYESGGDVIEDVEACVGGEEDFRDGEAADGGIVEGAFEPLRRVGVEQHGRVAA